MVLATSRGLQHVLDSYTPRTPHALGIIVVALGSVLCLWLAQVAATSSIGRTLGLSSLTLAIIIGMLLGNSVYPRYAPKLAAGVGFAKSKLLRLAIVFYGFKLTFTQVAGVGLPAVLCDALVLGSTFFLTYQLGTRWLKLDKQTTLLIGAGASICGAAAVIATEPVVEAKAHKVTIAVATVVVFGTLSMLLYPFLYHLGWLAPWLDAESYGIYSGSTIHEVAQVVVAGNAINADIGNTAVVTKMIRVMMLAPFLLLLSFILTAKQESNTEKPPLKTRLQRVNVPWFAFGFIVVVILHTWLPLDARLVSALVQMDNVLLTMAMFALGLTTHLGAIKEAGIKPLLLGAVVFGWLILGGGLINVGVSLL